MEWSWDGEILQQTANRRARLGAQVRLLGECARSLRAARAGRPMELTRRRRGTCLDWRWPTGVECSPAEATAPAMVVGAPATAAPAAPPASLQRLLACPAHRKVGESIRCTQLQSERRKRHPDLGVAEAAMEEEGELLRRVGQTAPSEDLWRRPPLESCRLQTALSPRSLVPDEPLARRRATDRPAGEADRGVLEGEWARARARKCFAPDALAGEQRLTRRRVSRLAGRQDRRNGRRWTDGRTDGQAASVSGAARIAPTRPASWTTARWMGAL